MVASPAIFGGPPSPLAADDHVDPPALVPADPDRLELALGLERLGQAGQGLRRRTPRGAGPGRGRSCRGGSRRRSWLRVTPGGGPGPRRRPGPMHCASWSESGSVPRRCSRRRCRARSSSARQACPSGGLRHGGLDAPCIGQPDHELVGQRLDRLGASRPWACTGRSASAGRSPPCSRRRRGSRVVEDQRPVLLAQERLVQLVDRQPGVVHRQQEPQQVGAAGSGPVRDQVHRLLDRPEALGP